MPLDHDKTAAIDAMRQAGLSDRKIASTLEVSYNAVRRHKPAEPLAIPDGNGPRILVFDIETAPTLGWVWSLWKTNVIATEQDTYILSVAWKFLGEDQTHFLSIADDPNFTPDSTDDRFVVERIHELFDQADVLVGHNSDKFDIRRVQARFLFHDLDPTTPFQTIDTLKEARRYFSHNSNSLKELVRLLDLGGKMENEGFGLWRKCMAGDPDAWKTMRAYNVMDVELTEGLYLRLLPWIGSPGSGGGINWGLYDERSEMVCPGCGRTGTFIKYGFHYTKFSKWQVYQCSRAQGGCGKRSRGRNRIPLEDADPQLV